MQATANFTRDVQGVAIGQLSDSVVNVNQQNPDLTPPNLGFESSDYREQKDSNPRSVNNTCKWILADLGFKAWYEAAESRLFHFLAGPGCGKSVLARYLIDTKLQGTEGSCVVYYFFKSGEGQRATAAAALAAMLHQLRYNYSSATGAAVEKHLRRRSEAHGTRLYTMFDELWDVLMGTLEDTATEIVCVLDAIDECVQKDQKQLMDAVSTFFSTGYSRPPTKGRLKFLITSRPYPELDFTLKHSVQPQRLTVLDVETKFRELHGDIKEVVEYLARTNFPKAPQGTQEALIKEILNKDNRTYLWISLIFEYLKQNAAGRGTISQLKSLIAQLPPKLDEAYHHLLSRGQDIERTMKLLSLVIAAQRPLSVFEVKLALTLSEGVYSSIEEIELESDEQFKDSLRNLSGLMLRVSDSKVFFIHETAREYLLRENGSLSSKWKGSIRPEEAHALLNRVCLSFLDLKWGKVQPPWMGMDDEEWFRSRLSYRQWDWPYKSFLGYSIGNWSLHFRSCHSSPLEESSTSVWNLLKTVSDESCPWLPLYFLWLGHRVCVEEPMTFKISKLQFCAAEGLDTLVVYLLKHEDANVNAEHGPLGTPLLAATARRHLSTVKLLLESGAEDRDCSALRTAIGNNSCDILQVLLKNRKDGQQQLDPRGAKFAESTGAVMKEKRMRNLDEALWFAVRWNYEDLVRQLIDGGANINGPRGGDPHPPLHVAISEGHERLILLLLALGADVNATDLWDRPAIHVAVCSDRLGLIPLLLENGADINYCGAMGLGSVLETMAYQNKADKVRFLLEKGAKINLPERHGGGPLHEAAHGGYKAVVEELLAHGSDVEVNGEQYKRAVQAASKNGHDDIVQLLQSWRCSHPAKRGNRRTKKRRLG